MKNIFLMLSLIISIQAFAEEDDFLDYTKYTLTKDEVATLSESLGEKLKDPDSIRFANKNVRAILSGGKFMIVGCEKFNAKNSYGGYGNSSVVIFMLPKNNNKIRVFTTIIEIEDIGRYEQCQQVIKKWSE